MPNDTGINGKKEQHDDNVYNCQCTAALVSVRPRWSKLKLAASQSRAASITFIHLFFTSLHERAKTLGSGVFANIFTIDVVVKRSESERVPSLMW